MAPRPPFAQPGTFNTLLDPLREFAFRDWVAKNNVPFDANAPVTDYDMRGYWQGRQQGNPQASLSSLNENDGRMHYPDYYKTPLHQSFSNESQWAGAGTPQWVNGSQLASPSGRVVYDEEAPQGLLSLLNLSKLGQR